MWRVAAITHSSWSSAPDCTWTLHLSWGGVPPPYTCVTCISDAWESPEKTPFGYRYWGALFVACLSASVIQRSGFGGDIER